MLAAILYAAAQWLRQAGFAMCADVYSVLDVCAVDVEYLHKIAFGMAEYIANLVYPPKYCY